MCRMATVLRDLVGIRDYRPGETPHALVRKPTRFGQRSRVNGTYAFETSANPVIRHLTWEHQLIRLMIADASRCGTRRHG